MFKSFFTGKPTVTPAAVLAKIEDINNRISSIPPHLHSIHAIMTCMPPVMEVERNNLLVCAQGQPHTVFDTGNAVTSAYLLHTRVDKLSKFKTIIEIIEASPVYHEAKAALDPLLAELEEAKAELQAVNAAIGDAEREFREAKEKAVADALAVVQRDPKFLTAEQNLAAAKGN